MSENDPKDLELFVAARLRLMRKQSKTRIKAMARVAHCSYANIQKYESGEVRIPLTALYAFSKLMNVNINTFFPNCAAVQFSSADIEFLDIFKELRKQTKSKDAVLRYFGIETEV